MRERGELNLKPLPSEGNRIAELQAEIARLKAGSALPDGSDHQSHGATGDVPMVVERMPIDPAEADITPPGELGECYAGIRPGPDDPPRRSPPVIDGKAVRLSPTNPPVAPAAPKYDYNRERGWRDHVLPSGEITPTPMSRGRWWGPV
jgi:hypothetical protein